MITTEQLAAAQAFLSACTPANALARRPDTLDRRTWQTQLQAAQADLRATRTAMQDLCGTRAVYQEALAAARDAHKQR
jgi:hypothetical protein